MTEPMTDQQLEIAMARLAGECECEEPGIHSPHAGRGVCDKCGKPERTNYLALPQVHRCFEVAKAKHLKIQWHMDWNIYGKAAWEIFANARHPRCSDGSSAVAPATGNRAICEAIVEVSRCGI